MARLFVFIVVFGGLLFGMCATKPTEADYLSKLEDRAAIVASSDHDAFSQLRGGDPVDEMVAGHLWIKSQAGRTPEQQRR